MAPQKAPKSSVKERGKRALSARVTAHDPISTPEAT